MNVLMHMADGLISVNIGVIFTIISVIMLGLSIKEMYQQKDERKIPMMAVMGALIFAGQMINFTIPATGSSGHIGGAILLCIVLGQYPAFLSLASVLLIQCLFFGDGGLLALGCNIFNMGVIPCFLAYPLIVKPIINKSIDSKHLILASVLGCVVGLEIGAFGVVLETLLSGITELPFVTFVSLMLPIHLAIGLVEGIVTSSVVMYVYKSNPSIIEHAIHDQSYEGIQLKKTIEVLAVLSILVAGGLSLYASSNPDGLEWSILNVTGSEEVEVSGEVKEELSKVQETTSILPDYNFKDSDNAILGGVSGVIGVGVTLVLIGAIGYIVTKKKSHE